MKNVIINIIILSVVYGLILRGWLNAINQAKLADKIETKSSFKIAGWGGVFGSVTTYLVCVIWVYFTLDNGSLIDALGLGSIMGLAIGLTGGNLFGMGIGYLIGKSIERSK